MQLWCVPSHHDLHGEPWDRKGVQIFDEDLATASEVWRPDLACSSYEATSSQISFTRRFSLDPRSAEYITAMRALIAVERPRLVAVLSLRWATNELRRPSFLTTKRVWLGVYDRGGNPSEEVWGLHHESGGKQQPLYSFLDAYGSSDKTNLEQVTAFFRRELGAVAESV